MVFTMNLTHLLVLFSIESRTRPKAVQGAQRDPTGTPGRPKGLQRTANGSPKSLESQRHPSRPQGVPQVPRDGQVEPKGIPKGAEGSPMSFQKKPKAPKDTRGKPAGHYIFANSRSTAPADVMLITQGLDLTAGWIQTVGRAGPGVGNVG